MRRFFTADDAVVPMLHPRILVEFVVERGGDRAQALRDTGIPDGALSSPEARISYAQFGRLIANARRITGDAALGVEFGHRIHLKNLGMLGVLVMNSRTVGEALQAALAHHRSLAPMVELRLDIQAHEARLACGMALPIGGMYSISMEMLLGALDNSARALIGDDFRAKLIRLDYPRPAHAETYAGAFHAERFEFDAPRTEVIWDAAALGHPITAHDPIMAKIAQRECDAQAAPWTRGLLGQVRGQLHAKPGSYPSMTTVARKLQTSPRSLRRHLAEIDTTYNDLVDEARRRHAEDAIRNTTLTLAEIAELLAYGDVRSFRRAWVRWTGTTPGEYRRGLSP